MKKTVLSFLFLLSTIMLGASVLPSYDFTFYATADESLTSFTSENVGIDVTGYGFVGRNSSTGIYIRLGIQTPFDTLLRLRDYLFKGGGSTSKESGEINITEKTTEPERNEENTPPLSNTAVLSAAAIENGQENLTLNEQKEQTATGETPSGETAITIDSSSDMTSASTGKKTSVNPTKWKFLLTAGPAWRSMLNDNAMVYAGIGLSVNTEYINDFTYENGNYYSSFSAVLGTDMDAGFRLGLTNSSTTIRIGVHFMTDVIGYSQFKIYDAGHLEISKDSAVYGYIAGKRGLAAATTGRGYIRLAKTIIEKRTVRYNYSNTTRRVGAGVVETITL